MLTAEQIHDNWKIFQSEIKDLFPGRADALAKLYDDLGERMALAPASSISHFHNAFEGGYVDHILRVMEFANMLYDVYEKAGMDMHGFTKEELMFAAVHHDLGKIGFPGDGGEIYQPNDSEWHRKNQGRMYKINENNPFTMVPDLSIWLLQKYGVEMTWNEFQAIRIHDGLYDEGNRPYFISRSESSKLKTNMVMILHQADMMASRKEYEAYRDKKPSTSIPKRSTRTGKSSISSSNKPMNTKDMFNDLFG